MLCNYEDILDNYNPAVPHALRFPDTHGETVTVNDETMSCQLTLIGENVMAIDIVADDDKIETGGFYPLWVKGFEGGLGWESINYYHAMQATLADHAEHTGVNDQGIEAVHSWADGRVHMHVTRSGKNA